jgi:dihydroorotate dehydrogenase
MVYKMLFRLVFSKLDPENVHHLVASGLILAGKLGFTKIFRIRARDTKVVEAFGLQFDGPFGLAAGFDKDAKMIKPLADLGFSHIEIGTVTAIAQPGNEKPRLFRLPADKALINRMGFNNQGAAEVAKRLRALRAKGGKLPIIGVNIGKSKMTPLENAVTDYGISAELLAPFADYLAVNVSSPNTPGLRSLQSIQALRPILLEVLAKSLDKPVLVKIAPDLLDDEVIEVADLAMSLGLAGVIATNTTISRSGLLTPIAAVDAMGDGGLSGAPVKNRSIEVLKLLNARISGRIAIVSVGGIDTVESARERLDLGANLVQGYTGFVYEGPFWARRINRGLGHKS